MGSRLGPIIANIFMDYFECRHMDELTKLGVKLWLRGYVFSFLHIPILGVILKKLFSQGAASDLVQIFFFTLSLVILKIFRGQNFNLGLDSKNF